MKARLEAMKNGEREEDRRLLRAQVDSAEARVAFSVQELKRAEQLRLSQAVSEAEYDEKVQNEINAKMALRVAEEELAKGEAGARKEDVVAVQAEIRAMEAKLRTVQDRLADTTLRAPFDGIVTNRMIENFEMVSLSQEVLALHDISKLKVRVFLPESELIRRPRSADMEVDVVLTEEASRSYKARLFEIDTNPTETKGMYAVTYLFDMPEEINVLPGMTAEITISGTETPEPRLVVPASAVLGNEFGESYVWTLDSATSLVTKKMFRRGMLTRNQKYVVLSGLDEGTLVVTEGNRFLAEGAKVHVEPGFRQ